VALTDRPTRDLPTAVEVVLEAPDRLPARQGDRHLAVAFPGCPTGIAPLLPLDLGNARHALPPLIQPGHSTAETRSTIAP